MANRVSVALDMNVQGYVQGMNQASDSTEKYETDLRKIKDSTGNFRKEFSAAKKDVLNLAQAYSKLDAEAKKSAFGQEMARQLQEAKAKAAEMQDMMGDMNTELKNMASDTRVLDTLSEGMGVFANATSTAMGLVAQFTGNEKAAQQAVVMFTTAQSTLNTLTALGNALQGQSNTMLAVNKVRNLASAAAIRVKTAAEGKSIVTTKAATVAQAAFNKVAMMNPYVLLATVILAAGAALYAFASKLSDAKEKEEQAKKAAEAAKEAFEQERQTMSNAAESFYVAASKIKSLKEQYDAATSSLQKTAVLKQASEEFKKLGINVNNLNDAQKILVQNGDKVIEMIKAQGNAAAYAAIRTQIFQDKFNELYKSKHNSLEDAFRLTTYMLEKDLNFLDGKITEERSKASSLENQLKSNGIKFGSSESKKGPKIDYDKGSLEDLQKELNKWQDLLKKKKLSPINVEKAKNEIERLTKEIEEKEIELGFKTPDPKKIPYTEAWYKDQISQLEQKKQALPLDAYIEREKLQNQIDQMNLKVKLQTEGVTVTGNANLSKALKGTYEKTINGTSNAISALQEKMQDLDPNSDKFKEYADAVSKLRGELQKLQKTYDEAVLSPQERMQKSIDKMKEHYNSLSDVVGQVGSAFSALGSIFNSVGNDAVAAMMQTVAAVAQGASQIIPKIGEIIAAKEAEALAKGTASATDVPFPGNIAAIASIVATILGTFAQIASIFSGGFATGGIVGGSSYSGDRLLASLNSGEMVLNKRQQQSLFNLLDSDLMPQKGGTNVTVTGVIEGTKLLLVQKNTNKVRSKTGTAITF